MMTITKILVDFRIALMKHCKHNFDQNRDNAPLIVPRIFVIKHLV